MHRVALWRSSSEGPSRLPARGPIFSAKQTDGSLATECWSGDGGLHFGHAAFCWCRRQVMPCVAPTREKCPLPGECSSFAVRDVWLSRMCPSASAAPVTSFCLPPVFFQLWSLIRGQQVVGPRPSRFHFNLNCVCLPDQIFRFQRGSEEEHRKNWELPMTPGGSWRWILNTTDPSLAPPTSPLTRLHSASLTPVFILFQNHTRSQCTKYPSIFHTLITPGFSLCPLSSEQLPVTTSVTLLSLQLIQTSSSLLQSPSDHQSRAVVTPTWLPL